MVPVGEVRILVRPEWYGLAGGCRGLAGTRLWALPFGIVLGSVRLDG